MTYLNVCEKNAFKFQVIRKDSHITMGCFGQSRQESLHLLPATITGKTCGDNIADNNISPDLDHTDVSTPGKSIPSDKQLLFGYGLGLLGVALMTTGLACAQALEQSIPHSELNGFRFSFQLAIACPFLIGYNRCDVRVNRKLIGWVAVCAVLLTLASYGIYGAVYYLPLGVSSGIMYSIALIINLTIKGIQYKFVTWNDLISVIGCISGVTMITQPSFLFHNNNLSTLTGNSSYSSCHVSMTRATPTNFTAANWTSYIETDAASEKHKEEIIGYILCVSTGVVLASYTQVVNRKLSDVNSFIYIFWASLFGIASSFCIMAATETPYMPTRPRCITWFLLHSIMSGSFTIATYNFFQIVDPVVATLIHTLHIPVSFILQYTLFSDIFPGHANAVGISGSILVVLGNAFVPLYKLTERLCARRKTYNESNKTANFGLCKQNMYVCLRKLLPQFCSHGNRNMEYS